MLEFGAIAVFVIFLAVLWRKRFFWTLVQQSVISLMVLGVSLDQAGTNDQLVFAWILLLALSATLPKMSVSSNMTRYLKRLEFGAFGGGVFWSLILVAHLGSKSSVEGSILWTCIVFVTSFFSWLRDFPASGQESMSSTLDVILIGTRGLVQAILALIFVVSL